MGDRLEGTAKCLVDIRTFEGDLDTIEVHNRVRKSFVTLYSTQPTYTSGLSRWEHAEYGRLARLRNKEFKTEEQRCRCRLRSEENTSELRYLMRISYADFCLKTK